MPIYEYRCNQCQRKSSHFFRSFSNARQPGCIYCGSTDLVRVMSTFAVHQSWDSGHSLPSAETLSDFDGDDPRSTTEWVKGMRRDMGNSFGNEYADLGESMDSGGLDDGDSSDF